MAYCYKVIMKLISAVAPSDDWPTTETKFKTVKTIFKNVIIIEEGNNSNKNSEKYSLK